MVCAVLILFTAGCGAVTSSGGQTTCGGWPKSIPQPTTEHTTVSGSPSDSLFFAYWERNSAAQPVLEAFSQRDGKPQGDVLRLPAWPFTVQGPVRTNDGRLWFTISSGPCVRDGTAGGNPAPNTCSGSVVRFDPDARTSRVVLKAPSPLLIGDAVPSPGCVPKIVHSHVGQAGTL